MKSRPITTYSLVLAAGSVLLWSSQAGAAVPSTPVRLGKADIEAVARVACELPHEVGLDWISAYRFGERQSRGAEVHCESHAQAGGTPIHYMANCEKLKRVWSCHEPVLEIPAHVGANEVAVRPQNLTPEHARKIVEKVGVSGWFGDYSLEKALASPCYVGRRDDPELVEIRCQGWWMLVSLWCPEKGCTQRVISVRPAE